MFLEHDSLSRIRPLADPLRILTILAVANALITVALGLATGHIWSGLGLSCLLFGLALLIAPPSKPNAIYLRAFRTDRSTARLRSDIAAILGPDFRLSGIRPPRERTSVFMRFFLSGFFALRYAGTKFMELEAGDDWMATLWKTYQTMRLVLIDVRDVTPYVQQEIRLTIETVGTERVVFVVSPEKTAKEWRQLLAKYIGSENDPARLQLLDADPARVNSGQLESDLKSIVKQLPAGVPGESEPGRRFLLEHVSNEPLAKTGLSFMGKACAAAGVLASLSLGPFLHVVLRKFQEGDVNLILTMIILAFIAALLIRGLLLEASRANRLKRAGHVQGGIRAWSSILVQILLFLATPALVAVQLSEDLSPLAKRARETAAIAALNSISAAQIQYNLMYPEVGFACQLSALGGNTSGTSSATAAQLVSADIASGKKNGYTFEVSNCTRRTVAGREINTGYQIGAVPDIAGKTGDRGFCTDEKLDISYDPNGGTNCTVPLH